jgi:hypothetical protein
MPIPERFQEVRTGAWRVWVLADWKSRVPELIAETERSAGWPHRSKHARTRPIDFTGASRAYLKSYRPYRWLGVLKDAVRTSKPHRALVMSERLRQAGLGSPRVLAAGEHRAWGVLRGGFLLTQALSAPDLREFLGALVASRDCRAKRRALRALGASVARLHEAGFYHGDLVPPNVRVEASRPETVFLFLDHDRTRSTRGCVPLRQARRNLVQLNRFVVRGLTAADRWRVFRQYCAERGLDGRAARPLARWVIHKTIERRRRFDGIENAADMGFRALMQIGDTQSVCRGGRGDA